MMLSRKHNILTIFLLLIFPWMGIGQEIEKVEDSFEGQVFDAQDSTFHYYSEEEEAILIISEDSDFEIIYDDFKPDPMRAIWLGAVVPGYGQIVNRKYWKLPIVYGGFMGCYFAVDYNARHYITFKNAYLDIIDGDESTNSYLELIPEGYTIDSFGGKSAFGTMLKNNMERARYNRDLSVIITIAYYGLTLVDAFVDAHLFDYDISPDLSLKLRPSIIKETYKHNHIAKNQTAFGLSASLNF